MRKLIDLIGQKFNMLTVISFAGFDKSGNRLWLCKCDCCQEKIIPTYKLNGGVKSCGCLKNKIKHGHSKRNKKSKTHSIWTSMKQRCLNKNHDKYKYYGGKGITICDRWLEPNGQGFLNFLDDMGECPKGMFIDRIKNNKLTNGYSSENCKYSTWKEQCRNKTDNVILKYDNREQCLQDWSIERNIPHTIIKDRLNRGWSIEKALTTPVRKLKSDKSKSLQQSYDEMYKNIQFPISSTDSLWKYLNV